MAVECCISISGNGNISSSSNSRYKLSYPIECMDEDVIVYLSYGGSSLNRGTDFYSASDVIISSLSGEGFFTLSTSEDVVGNILLSIETENDEICESLILITVSEKIEVDTTRESCEEIGFFWKANGYHTRIPSYMK